MLRSIPGVRQHDQSDCGAACLASVAAHYGRQLPLAVIRKYASTDASGTSLAGIVAAAEHLGLAAQGVKGPTDSLRRVPLPAIALITTPRGTSHYVTLFRVERDSVTYMDPAIGSARRVSMEEFGTSWLGVLVLIAPRHAPRDRRAYKGSRSRLWSLAQANREALLWALCGTLVYALLGLATALYVQRLVDVVIPAGDQDVSRSLGFLMLAVVGTQAALGVLKSLVVLRTGRKIDSALILEYYTHLTSLPLRFFDSMRTGELLSRIADAVKVRAFVNETAVELALSLLMVACSLLVMFWYSWTLAFVASTLLPVLVLVYLWLNRSNRTVRRETMERAADLEAHLAESLGGIHTIRQFGAEASAVRRTSELLSALSDSLLRSGTQNVLASQAGIAASALWMVGLLWIGAELAMADRLTMGELLSSYVLLGYLSGPLTRVVTANRSLQDALIAADRLFEIQTLETGSVGATGELAEDVGGDITLECVNFRYGERGPVFADLSITFQRGEITGIAGESGSGKSTLARLIQGLYEVESGRIRFGRHAIQELAPADLRRYVAGVPQEVVLFSGTLAENIALGVQDPDLNRVEEVCSRLGLEELVRTLPAGVLTQLGERGSVLSGGERQRVALARALYREPQVLVLDEATSALDVDAETQVTRALRSLATKGTTIILIAHKVSTLRAADRIIVLGREGIIQDGTHAKLIAVEGPYRGLWERQTTSVA